MVCQIQLQSKRHRQLSRYDEPTNEKKTDEKRTKFHDPEEGYPCTLEPHASGERVNAQ